MDVIRIDDEFRSLIPILVLDEFNLLQSSILSEGCRDALVVWDEESILLDGHNRYEICQEHGVKYQILRRSFSDRDAAMVWIINNQFGRRNLNLMQRAELALKLKPLLAAQAKVNQVERKGNQPGTTKQNSAELSPVSTRTSLAKAAGVSHDTISKVEKIQKNAIPAVQQLAREGKISVNVAEKISKLPQDQQQASMASESTPDPKPEPESVSHKTSPKVRGKGLAYASEAIEVLKKIPFNDGLRVEAFEKVADWCQHNKRKLL